MSCCHIQEENRKPVFRKKCRKLANEIRDRDVKEHHIQERLTRIVDCENTIHAKRFEEKQPYSIESYRYRDGKTQSQVSLLHLAVSCDRDEVAEQIIDLSPNLSKTARMDDLFKGQTPFHIAVAKRKYHLVEKMIPNDNGSNELLSLMARGSSLKGTIMTGETPLSIAVLNCDEEMIKILLDNGADILQGDSTGNTVMHTIVMYAYYFPEKNENINEPHFKKAIKCVWDATKDNKRLRTLLHMTNDKESTPLQLACKKGLNNLFEHVVTLFCINKFTHDIWGVQDTFWYDVTEIDTVHWRESLKEEYAHQYQNIKLKRATTDNEEKDEDCHGCCRPCAKLRKCNKAPSALQAISQLSLKEGLEFMSVDVIEDIISRKWKRYRWWFGGFGLGHLILMVVLSYNTVAKTDALGLETKAFGTSLDTRFLVFNILNIFVALFYISQELVRKVLFRLPYFVSWSLHHNTICRLVFLLFGLFLFVDSLWNFFSPNNYVRYLALFFGWFGMIFFFRSVKFFSYHSVIILEIITGDVVRFVPIMVTLLLPFTLAAYESYDSTKEGFGNYADTLLTLFQWMNGIGEVQLDNLYKPGLSITVFVLFFLFANIILLQTLIALMSNNHITDINRMQLRRFMRLSVVVFFESILPTSWMLGTGENVPFENSFGLKHNRYLVTVNRANVEEIDQGSFHALLKTFSGLTNRYHTMIDVQNDTMTDGINTGRQDTGTLEIHESQQ